MADMKVAYEDHMGTDLTVVKTAKVSFKKRPQWLPSGAGNDYPGVIYQNHDGRPVNLSQKDASLIRFLARGVDSGDWEKLMNRVAHAHDRSEIEEIVRSIRGTPQHWSPFAHTGVQLYVTAPLFVARQLQKHQVGFNWNEVSRRYVDDEPEFWEPDAWRKRADNVKQGSGGPLGDVLQPRVFERSRLVNRVALREYNEMLADGVCAEQARSVLPQSMMTEWIWTGNVYGFSRVCRQRLDPHAQAEVGIIAQQISDIIEPLFPVSWKELMS